MIEFEEVMPLYESIEGDESRTPNAFYAKRQDSVIIFNAFMDRFFCYMDDDGRLVCAEKEDKDERR